MRLSIVADCHLNKAIYKGVLDKKYTTLPFRTVDFMKAFHFIVTQNIEKMKPNMMIIAGDIYDTYDPSNEVRAFFCRQLKRLEDAHIPVTILVGNHDICRKHHALSPIKGLQLDNVDIVEEPKMELVNDKVFLYFPYSIKVERGEIGIKEQFYEFIEESHKKIAETPEMQNREIFFFGHFGVKGAVLKQYTEVSDEHILTNKTTTPKKQRVNRSAEDIGFPDLETIKANYIFLGDYHQHQILPVKGSVAMYTGSTEKSDMSELDQEKGYIVYDDEYPTDEAMGKTKFMIYPKCRPMIEFRGNAKEIEKSVDDLPSKGNKGAIVKVAFVGSAKELSEFSVSLDAIYKKIKSKVDPVHIYDQQKITDELDEEETHQLEYEIIEKGQVNKELVLAAVDDMIVEKESDLDEQKILMGMSLDIYKEAMEE